MSQEGPDDPQTKKKGMKGFVSVLRATVDDVDAELIATSTPEETGPAGSQLLFRASMPQAELDQQNTGAGPILDDQNFAEYQNLFQDSPYHALGRLIETRNNEVQSAATHGQTHYFIRRLQNINPALEFAVRGARTAYQQAKASGDTASIEESKLTLDNFKKIQEFYLCLEAHANNKNRYTKEYFEEKVKTILKGIPVENHIDIVDAIRDSAGNEVATSRRFYQTGSMGSTEFDLNYDKLDLQKYNKRVKVQHEDMDVNGTKKRIVKAEFSYNRAHLMGAGGIKKYFANPAKAHSDLVAQTSDFVTIAIHEYGIGKSAAKPITFQYYGPQGTNLSEAAFAILMDYKQRAIIEQRSFYAKNAQGQIIEITPSTSLSPDEKAYFAYYGNQRPQSTSTKSQYTAGMGFLNQALGEHDLDLGAEDENQLTQAIEHYLGGEPGSPRLGWQAQHNQQMDEVMNKVANQLAQRSEFRPS